ncbi:MAG: hypothetical protein GKR89_28460 [Candidatus Latescibacteria bacterium]|nr:hypothetical protein [Candidatus Latescibacterota bacterium]
MKKSLLLLALTWIIAVFSLPANGHVGENPYLIYAFADEDLPDLHDGTLSDWLNVFPGPTLTEVDFGSLDVGEGASIGAPDLSAHIYLGWNKSQNRIYAAIERFDDLLINEYQATDPQGIGAFDSIECMVDGDHSGGQYANFNTLSLTDCELSVEQAFADSVLEADELDCIRPQYFNHRHAQLYQGMVTPSLGGLLAIAEQSRVWANAIPYSDIGGFVDPVNPQRTVIELMVTPYDSLDTRGPAYSLESVLEIGKTIGFQFSLADFDSGVYHGFHTLGGQADTWRDADTFVDGELLGTPAPTSMQGDSWGRIKASLQNPP